MGHYPEAVRDEKSPVMESPSARSDLFEAFNMTEEALNRLGKLADVLVSRLGDAGLLRVAEEVANDRAVPGTEPRSEMARRVDGYRHRINGIAEHLADALSRLDVP